MLILNQLIGFGASGASTSYSFLQGATDETDTATYTFSSQNLGAADSRRWIIVCIIGIDVVEANSITSVTVGGVSATKLVQAEASTLFRHASIWAAYVPTGTTGDIVAVFNNALFRAGYTAYRLLTDIDPTTSLYDFETDIVLSGNNLSVSIDRAPDGIIIAACVNIGGPTPTTATWTGVSEDYESTFSGTANQILSSASTNTGTSPVTVTCNLSVINGGQAMCAASFR